MRPAKFTRFFLVMAGAAISAGAFAGTAAADHRDSGYHKRRSIRKLPTRGANTGRVGGTVEGVEGIEIKGMRDR